MDIANRQTVENLREQAQDLAHEWGTDSAIETLQSIIEELEENEDAS